MFSWDLVVQQEYTTLRKAREKPGDGLRLDTRVSPIGIHHTAVLVLDLH